MCGIAGFLESSQKRCLDECEKSVRRMASALAHRGPDDEGTWVDVEAGVALAHRRLAIIDVSAQGHQPMQSADGRYVLTFNGEIYNWRPLRGQLEHAGHCFRGHSDTEVMLAAFSQWGVLPAVERFVGMFAFALWDRRERRLHLARDRAGEKPLYYGWTDGVFVFGSELKALRAHPRWRAEINRQALAPFTRHGYIPAPHCIYKNIYKLQAGSILTLVESDVRNRRTPKPEQYWSAQGIAEAGVLNPFRGDELEARGLLQKLLVESVGQQRVADVPVGAFLSGGIDSSLVVALMQAQSPRPLKSFSIGFDQESFDEAHFAKAVAHHLGTDHVELYVQPREAREIIPKLPCIYDEPFADSSQIPTAVLCHLTREHVKVSVSGDGGDELFGGYNRYGEAEGLWKVISRIPKPFHRLARHLNRMSAAGLNRRIASGVVRPVLNRVWELSDILSRSTDRSLYQRLISPNADAHSWLNRVDEPDIGYDMFPAWDRLPELLQRMMYHDLVCYLPDDILVKVDRAAMSVGLETRIPLLDHRIIEFAWSLPMSFKRKGNCGKWLLRQILYQYVPPTLVDRPKRGFGAPIAEWLRGPLREWAESLLDEARLRRENFFNARHVTQKWNEHLCRKRDWSSGLWHVLMFQAWLDEQRTLPGAQQKLPQKDERVSRAEPVSAVGAASL